MAKSRSPAQKELSGVAAASGPHDVVVTQQQRKDQLTRVALRMLEEGEYDSIQMREIAKAAGMSLSTVYRHFSSKEQLFASVLMLWVDGLKTEVDRRPLKGGDIPSQLKDLAHRVVAAFERVPQFFRMITALQGVRDTLGQDLGREHWGPARLMFAGPLAELAVDDQRAVLDVVMAVMGHALTQWSQGVLSLDQMRRRLDRSIELIFSPPPAPPQRPRAAPNRVSRTAQ